MLWDLKEIPALLLAAAVKWTDRILTVHIGQCSHEEQGAKGRYKYSVNSAAVKNLGC